MPFPRSRIRPFLALMQGLLCTVRGAISFGRVTPDADARQLSLSSVLTPGRTTTIERHGARRGTLPAARDGRHARSACAFRRDLPDVRRHPEPPGRPRSRGTCRTTSPRPPKHR